MSVAGPDLEPRRTLAPEVVHRAIEEARHRRALGHDKGLAALELEYPKLATEAVAVSVVDWTKAFQEEFLAAAPARQVELAAEFVSDGAKGVALSAREALAELVKRHQPGADTEALLADCELLEALTPAWLIAGGADRIEAVWTFINNDFSSRLKRLRAKAGTTKRERAAHPADGRGIRWQVQRERLDAERRPARSATTPLPTLPRDRCGARPRSHKSKTTRRRGPPSDDSSHQSDDDPDGPRQRRLALCRRWWMA